MSESFDLPVNSPVVPAKLFETDSICFNCVNNKNEPVVPLMPEYAQHFKSIDILDITK